MNANDFTDASSRSQQQLPSSYQTKERERTLKFNLIMLSSTHIHITNTHTHASKKRKKSYIDDELFSRSFAVYTRYADKPKYSTTTQKEWKNNERQIDVEAYSRLLTFRVIVRIDRKPTLPLLLLLLLLMPVVRVVVVVVSKTTKLKAQKQHADVKQILDLSSLVSFLLLLLMLMLMFCFFRLPLVLDDSDSTRTRTD